MAQEPPTATEQEAFPEPPQLRRLRRLVSLLVAVMIVGILTVAVVMVLRLVTLRPAPAPLGPPGAEALVLPPGAEIVAIGRAPGEVLVVTRAPSGAETLRILDASTGRETRAVPIRRE